MKATENITPEVEAIDADEFAVAEKEAEASTSTYTHKFKRPFIHMGQTYTELRFDWDSLTGQDGLDIEAELQMLGNAVVVPAFSGPYLVRMAAKACTTSIGADAFGLMSLADYNKIRSAARSFLLTSE